MCETAKLQILFSESRARWRRGNQTDLVSVMLLEYSGTDRVDCILERRVVVDNEYVIYDRKVVGDLHLSERGQAGLIRQAITEFDQLLAGHPTLAEKESDSRERPA